MKIGNIITRKIWPVLALSMLFVSCEKFLGEPPSKTTQLVVKTTDHLHALLNNYSRFYTETNESNNYSTDDYGLTVDLNDARRGYFGMGIIHFLTWDTQHIPEGGDFLWSNEYSKIFTANLVLNSLDDVTGPESEKAILRADAHFVRAYSYWILANTYCLPYTEANKTEMGLPIKTSTSFEQPLERQSLEKTYQQIEADLAEALKTSVTLQTGGQPRHWRASKAGVNGFAARYYLNRNNYDKALEHANAALAEYSALVDYNTEMRAGVPGVFNVTPMPPGGNQVEFPYTHDHPSNVFNPIMTDIIGWKEFLYFRVLNNGSWWIIPSEDLLDLYDRENDLRFRWHVAEHASYLKGFTNPPYDAPAYVFFWDDNVPSGPTVAEMLLTKAEAQARLGDFSGAMSTLQQLRVKRMKTGTPALSASSKEEAIEIIIAERRREMPFAQRWFDLRRYNNNEDPNDDVVLTRTFYPYTNVNVAYDQSPQTYTLPSDSRRYAAPIPVIDIISSQGVLQQNTY